MKLIRVGRNTLDIDKEIEYSTYVSILRTQIVKQLGELLTKATKTCDSINPTYSSGRVDIDCTEINESVYSMMKLNYKPGYYTLGLDDYRYRVAVSYNNLKDIYKRTENLKEGIAELKLDDHFIHMSEYGMDYYGYEDNPGLTSLYYPSIKGGELLFDFWDIYVKSNKELYHVFNSRKLWKEDVAKLPKLIEAFVTLQTKDRVTSALKDNGYIVTKLQETYEIRHNYYRQTMSIFQILSYGSK